MTVSKAKICREMADDLREKFARQKSWSIRVHSFGASVLCIANEANQIGGENIGGSSSRVAANLPVRRTGDSKNGAKNGGKSGAKSGDGDGDGDGDSDASKTAPNAKRRRGRLVRTGIPLEGYARLSQILDVIPVSKSSWYAGVKSGKYPSPVKLGPRTTAWLVSDIRDLIESLAKMPSIAGFKNSECVLSGEVTA
jgi:prophage regulatory protein